MKNNRHSFLNTAWYILAVLIICFFTLWDQISKYFAVKYLKGQPARILIPKILELRYLENKGMAFGLFSGKIPFFVIIGILFFIFAVYFFIRIPKTPFYYPVIFIELILTAGAVGNFIDRILHGYVIDFIYFKLIDFPIFNIADIYVVASCISLMILIIFKYEDQHFQFISPSKKKQETRKE